MQVHPLSRQKRRSRSDHASATFGYIEILDFEDGSGGSTIWWRSNGAPISPFVMPWRDTSGMDYRWRRRTGNTL